MPAALRQPWLPGVLAALLLGCQATGPAPPVAPAPVARPEERPARPSEVSVALSRHYARVEADLLDRGLMRTDDAAEDVPFNRRDLVRNFLRVALYDEYVPHSGALVARETKSRLRRWEKPVRMGLIFGDTIPEARRRADRAEVTAYATRLSALTGLSIRQTAPESANFLVLFLNEDERRGFGPELQRLVPGIDATGIRTITDVPRSTFCLVLAFSQGGASSYSRAIALIRSEQPDRLRQSCIHEELAQGMGLANDSPAARPSIFNDDKEFALLTGHDELLLRILYDRRLQPGMTEEEARPIVEAIAAELVPEGS